MKLNPIKSILKCIFGGFNDVIEDILESINYLLEFLDASDKERVQTVLNYALSALSIARMLQIFCPVKWQTAYSATIQALQHVVDSLQDLKITNKELETLKSDFKNVVKYWKSDDDDTCKE